MQATRVLSAGPFASLLAIKDCLCPDGKRRLARVTGEADTFFSVPARVTYRGKTVTGFVSFHDGDGAMFQAESDWRFTPNAGGVNGKLFAEEN